MARNQGPHKRHVIKRVMRPGSGTTARGEQDPSSDTEVASGVPCSIETLRGRELEIQRQTYAPAQFRIRFFVDSRWRITPSDYLILPDDRVLGIGSVGDPNHDGVEVELICGEGDSS